MNVAELLIPAVRWDPEHGYGKQRDSVEHWLEAGAGGFILFGGRADAARELIAEMHARSRVPLLVGADLERGAGQQFEGCTALPPLGALGSLADSDIVRRAAAITAREARGLGINWVFAPVLDLDIEPENPIVGTRALGADPAAVARLGSAWIRACQEEKVLACAKHFPGHGRTTTDSHAELPQVTASREQLEREDLEPFLHGVRAGVASVMTAHVTFPTLDPGGVPATLSRGILSELLRKKLGYEELIVTDALIMAGVRQQESEAGAAVRALAAGCDLLLYPDDFDAVLRGLEEALAAGVLRRADVERSLQRRRRWAEWARIPGADAGPHAGASGAPAGTSTLPGTEAGWASAVACRVVTQLRGTSVPLSGPVALAVVDDDLGGPYPPPSREHLAARLRDLGVAVRTAETGPPRAREGGDLLIAIFGDVRAWKGRAGYSSATMEAVQRQLAVAHEAGVMATIVQFSHPRLVGELPPGVPIVNAWGGEEVMQRAAADWLVLRCAE